MFFEDLVTIDILLSVKFLLKGIFQQIIAQKVRITCIKTQIGKKYH